MTGSALLTVAASSVSALGGVILGGLITSKREHKAWLRERRFDAIKDATSAARTMLWRGDEIGAAGISLAESKERVRTAMFDLRQAVTILNLVSAQSVQRAASSMRTYFGDELFDYFMTLQSAPDDDSEEVKQARQLLRDFIDAARDDIL